MGKIPVRMRGDAKVSWHLIILHGIVIVSERGIELSALSYM